MIALINTQKLVDGLNPIRKKHSANGYNFLILPINCEANPEYVFMNRSTLRNALDVLSGADVSSDLRDADPNVEVQIYLAPIYDDHYPA